MKTMLEILFNTTLLIPVAFAILLFTAIPAASTRAASFRLHLGSPVSSRCRPPADVAGHRATPPCRSPEYRGELTAAPSNFFFRAPSRASSTPPGCGWSCGLRSGGVARRLAQPPATFAQPSGLKATGQADVRVGPSMGLPVRPAYKLGDHPLLGVRTLLFSHCRHLTTHLSVRVRHSLPTRPTPNLALWLFAIWPFPSPLFSNSPLFTYSTTPARQPINCPLFSNSPLFTHSINSKFGPLALCHLAL